MSILPRTNSYKRVPGDDPDDRGRLGGRGGFKRCAFGWKKFVIGSAIIIGLVYLLGPRERREAVWDGIKRPVWKGSPTLGEPDMSELPPPIEKPTRPPPVDMEIPTPVDEDFEDDIINDVEPVAPSTPKPTHPVAPHSPADDPDPSGSVFCKADSVPDGKPVVQYALMIDAGSTGSRIHIYKFNNCFGSPRYEYEVFKQKQPGLSSFKGNPDGAAASLDELMDTAMETVPDKLRACTPVAVKATAGLRLLGATDSNAILSAVQARLRSKYPFSVIDKDGVVIMDGKDEGVYAWVTANYLLNTIRADSPSTSRTYAVLDLGGASTQIVFEPNFDEDQDNDQDGVPDSKFEQGEHRYELSFGGRNRTLYQHSYLGYGLMEARKSTHRLIDFVGAFSYGRTGPGGDGAEELANPCLSRGTSRSVEVAVDGTSNAKKNITMTGADVGGFDSCKRVIELVLAKDAVCKVKPCSFNGVYQPSMLETFAYGKVLLLSYFADRVGPFYSHLSEQPQLTVSSIADLAQDVCRGKDTWERKWSDNPTLLEELEGRPEYCLDLTFMYTLLRLGYEFEDEREVRVEKQIDGTELGWCLGATIAMIGGELTCAL